MGRREVECFGEKKKGQGRNDAILFQLKLKIY